MGCQLAQVVNPAGLCLAAAGLKAVQCRSVMIALFVRDEIPIGCAVTAVFRFISDDGLMMIIRKGLSDNRRARRHL